MPRSDLLRLCGGFRLYLVESMRRLVPIPRPLQYLKIMGEEHSSIYGREKKLRISMRV